MRDSCSLRLSELREVTPARLSVSGLSSYVRRDFFNSPPRDGRTAPICCLMFEERGNSQKLRRRPAGYELTYIMWDSFI